MDAQIATRRTADEPSPVELTVRGTILGAGITLVFMAANVYMGLKTGMTFSSSIPAAMISMGALRLMGGADIHENNIVQTQASAAGTLCNIILALPGLVLIGHWQGFPFWQTTAVCGVGGLLGVAFSIPLRRALIAGTDLPYPEGIAAAEVLKTGQGDAGAKGLRDLLTAAGAAGLIGLATTGFKLLGDSVGGAISLGGAVFRTGTGFSLALVGVGYLVGIGACLALFTGVVIAWGIAVPVLTALSPDDAKSAKQAAEAVWSEQVRLIGAGIIAVGGLWTVASLSGPILGSIRSAFSDAGGGGGGLREDHPREERDLPITWVAGGMLALCLPLAATFTAFAWGTGLGSALAALVAGVTLFAVLFGFLMAAACGYLAGLLGSSSSPISGIGVLTTMATTLLLSWAIGEAAGPGHETLATGTALLLTSVIVTTASIANDNLQDLKTGQIVGATPWHQQVALIIGVLVGSSVIAPLLSLLYGAYGFVGAPAHEGQDAANAMPAPQAALMTQIADGIAHHHLPWTMVAIGAGLGVVLVAVETLLRKRGLTFPALTVGIGMYLPLSVEVTIAIGGVLGWLAQRRLRRRGEGKEGIEGARRRGVLLASGFLVGESFVGVLLAGADLSAGKGSSLALVGPDYRTIATWLGAAVFAVSLGVYFRLVSRPA
jgi:putative OPT family oligopeptide transporter